jgi:hypothetical protein
VRSRQVGRFGGERSSDPLITHLSEHKVPLYALQYWGVIRPEQELWVNAAGEPVVIDGNAVVIDFDDPTFGGAAGPVFVSIETASRL